MLRKALRFLGWVDRKPGQIWPFPFAGIEPLKRKPPKPYWADDERC